MLVVAAIVVQLGLNFAIMDIVSAAAEVRTTTAAVRPTEVVATETNPREEGVGALENHITTTMDYDRRPLLRVRNGMTFEG